MPNLSKRGRLWAILCLTCLLLATNIVAIQAQETTPEITVEAPTVEPVIPTTTPSELPTEIPVEATPDVTPVVETDEPIATEAATAEPTAESTPVIEDALPPEPALMLLVRELFDNGDLTPWQPLNGWSLAGTETGAALQATNTNQALSLQKGLFYNVAVEARFQFNTGSAQISVRQSAAGGYTASVDATGVVQLLRAGLVVKEGIIQPAAGDAWLTLRLSAIDGAVRVSVDGVTTLEYSDDAPLPPGEVTLGALFEDTTSETAPTTNVLLVDDFFLWVPQHDAAAYPSPTPQSTTVPVTEEATPEATVETTPQVTEVPVEATETPVATEEPIIEATAEATDTAPEITPEASIEEATPVPGKAAAEPPTEEELVGALATGNDNFGSASTITPGTLGQVYIPYTDSGDSTGNQAGREANEPSSTCGYNISYTFWYRFTPANTASYIFTTAGSSIDTIVAVYKGNSLTGAAADNINTPANKLGCNDDASAATFTSQVTVPLTAGTEYRIQVGGYDGAQGPFQFKVMQAGVPAPALPVLGLPGAGWTINDTTPTLTWGVSTNGYRYELQVDNNSNFSSPEITQSGIGLTSFTTAALADGIYYWRVRALNVNDLASAYTAGRAFTVRTTAPVQNLPAAGAVSTTTRPTFTWAVYAGATKYHLVINDNNDCTTTPVFEKNDIVPATLALTAVVRPQPLLPGNYYWCVRAYDIRNAGDSWGVFSTPRPFTVNPLSLPADNAVSTNTKPVFSWVASTVGVGLPAPQYRLEIDNNNDFSSLSYEIEDFLAASHTLPTPLTSVDPAGYGTYYWRVKISFDGGATYGPANPPPRKIIISPSVPVAPVLTGPLNNSTTGDNTPLLTWNASTSPLGGPFSYELEVATAATFGATNILSDSNAPGDTDYQIGGALAEGAKFWHVRTINQFGAPSAWSATFKFTVDTTVPAPPNQVNPAAGLTTNLVRPTLTWSAVPGAVRYEVRVNQNNNCTTSLLNNNPHSVVTPSLALAATVLTTPLAQGDYYWCVQAIDAGNNPSGYTGPRKFTVNLSNAPANNANLVSATNNTLKPSFTWAAAGLPAGTTYNIRVFETTDFSGTPFYTLASPIATLAHVSLQTFPYGDYFWQVGVNGVYPPNNVYFTFAVSPAAIVAPVLTAPLNNGFTNDTTPLLDWNATTSTLGGPFSYEVQVASANTFAADTIVEEGTTPAGDTDFNEIAPDLTPGPYFWRVRAKNSFGAYSPYSAVFKFTVDGVTPGTTSQINLAADAVTNVVRPTFSWSAAPNAAKYNVIVNDNNDCTTTPVVDYTTPTAVLSLNLSAAVMAQPLAQGDHYWCVRAVSAGGNPGPFAGPRKFTVNLSNLPAADANIITATTSNPSFTWLTAGLPAGTTYTVRVYSGENCSGGTAYVSPAVTTLTNVSTTALNPGRYCWHVAVNGVIPPASVKRNFTITPTLPVAPVLVNPATGSAHATMPTLDWNATTTAPASGGPFKYIVEISDLPTFAVGSIVRTVTDLTATEYLIAPALGNGTYYWRVKTVNTYNAVGSPSAVRSFIIDDQGTDAPTLLTPVNNSSTTSKLPLMTWSVPPGAVKYDIRFGTNPDLTAVQTISVNQLAVARFTPVSNLLATTYYWQVRARDAAGNPSPWSSVFSYKVTSLLTDSPVPNRYTDNTPLLTWGPISWAASGGYYEVQVDDNANFSSPVFQRTALLGNAVAGGQNNVEVTPALPNATYYWRVRACPAVGACGAYSSTGVFTVEN